MSTIARACCTSSQITYWIVFSEFRTMLLGWSSGCTNSAISHQSWPHCTPCQLPDRFQDRTAGLQSPKWSSPSLYRRSPAALWSTRKLRSADKQLLSQPPCRLKSYGDRAFCCAAPVVWNHIPDSVKTAKIIDSFKVKIKTHFYSVSFA